MADILSQEEIDRLLGATVEDTRPGGSDLSPEDTEVVERLTRAFFASANSAFGSLLARSASVSEGVGQGVGLADLEVGHVLLVRFPFRSGFDGEMVVLLPLREASILADLVLGGEGSPKEALDDADLDALKEALAQVAGSGAPTLSAALDREVGFGPARVEEVEAGQLATALPWGHAFLASGTVKVEDALDAPLRILLPATIAREMARQAREEEPPLRSVPGGSPGRTAPAPRSHAGDSGQDIGNIDLILDIEVDVMVRLGEAVLPLKGIQRLRPGSIVDLDRDTDTPIELVVNDKVIAKGELVVVNSDHFALRITEIETPVERIRTLGP